MQSKESSGIGSSSKSDTGTAAVLTNAATRLPQIGRHGAAACDEDDAVDRRDYAAGYLLITCSR